MRSEPYRKLLEEAEAGDTCTLGTYQLQMSESSNHVTVPALAVKNEGFTEDTEFEAGYDPETGAIIYIPQDDS